MVAGWWWPPTSAPTPSFCMTCCHHLSAGLWRSVCRVVNLMLRVFLCVYTLIFLICFLWPDHCNWALWQYQCSGKDPTGLLLWPHIHPAMGERTEVDARSSAGRGGGSHSARCRPALDHDGGAAGGHPVQVRWEFPIPGAFLVCCVSVTFPWPKICSIRLVIFLNSREAITVEHLGM